ncbi:unnamed protein product [Schistocephalus solidus]|uniref:TMEM132D_N domain-containing protein n=1 Tax=Schistocephalus solidus TaxID=70667 RepID=A0A183SQB3_SCHSO|nr:unnamed protein product [Schistocephalus solidus]
MIRGSRPGQFSPFSSPTKDAEYRKSKNNFHILKNWVEPGFELSPSSMSPIGAGPASPGTPLVPGGLRRSRRRFRGVAGSHTGSPGEFHVLNAPLHLPHHGVDAEDSGPLQDFRVRDPVLPSQLQYSAKVAQMKVIQPPGLVRVDGPDLRSVKECR